MLLIAPPRTVHLQNANLVDTTARVIIIISHFSLNLVKVEFLFGENLMSLVISKAVSRASQQILDFLNTISNS